MTTLMFPMILILIFDFFWIFFWVMNVRPMACVCVWAQDLMRAFFGGGGGGVGCLRLFPVLRVGLYTSVFLSDGLVGGGRDR